jgi:glycosyltransferase involved in cell wall biosynthesis
MTNSPFAPTGYGIQMREIGKRLIEDGHEVAVACNFGLSGAAINWNGMVLYPLRMQEQCADVIGHYAQHFGADICVTLYDVWALPGNWRERCGVPWAAMVPLDGAPINRHATKRLQTAQYVIAYSQHAQVMLEQAGFDVDYCPHGIDTGVYQPGDKSEARRKLGIPQDRYMISTVAANKGYPPRKAWPEMFTAVSRFAKNHGDILYYCHTTKRPYGSGNQGIYLDQLQDAVGMPDGIMAYPDPGAMAIGVPDEQIAKIYQASDVMLLTSMGEGFGLPIIEAQACGCPVVTQDCTAMSEITANGISIPPIQGMWLPQLEYWWQVPFVEWITQALEKIRAREDADKQNQSGVEYIQENYDYDAVWAKHWRPLIKKIEYTIW